MYGCFKRRANFIDKSKVEYRHCIVDDLKSIHIFKDASSIEFFVNNGVEVFSSRVFDNLSDDSISFQTSGVANIDVKKWDLKRVCQ